MDVKIESSWKNVLREEFDKEYFQTLVGFVKSEYKNHPQSVFPPGNSIFKAFEKCPFEKVKIVILGQDPYPTKGHAHGLCFSVMEDVRPLPKSLINIYKELTEDMGVNTSSRNGNLEHWAEQGVLLLNATLTVREGQPESHANKGWEIFTDAVIQKLNQEKEGIVYLLWGSKAIQKAKTVSRDKNLVLTAPHPSPLSAYRGFFGCHHFSKANDYLERNNKSPIKW